MRWCGVYQTSTWLIIFFYNCSFVILFDYVCVWQHHMACIMKKHTFPSMKIRWEVSLPGNTPWLLLTLCIHISVSRDFFCCFFQGFAPHLQHWCSIVFGGMTFKITPHMMMVKAAGEPLLNLVIAVYKKPVFLFACKSIHAALTFFENGKMFVSIVNVVVM